MKTVVTQFLEQVQRHPNNPAVLDIFGTYPFSAAGARLELELLENEYGDGGFDSEMEYAQGLFDADRMKAFHELYVDILERIVAQQDIWVDKTGGKQNG